MAAHADLFQPNHTHLIVGSKGGIGKSTVASLTAQLLAQGAENRIPESGPLNLLVADTDPSNQTLSRIKQLNPRFYQLGNPDFSLNLTVLDTLVEDLAGHNGHAVIDTGASIYQAIMAYMRETSLHELLHQHCNTTLIIHTVLNGGVDFTDTVNCLKQLLEHTPSKLVIWLNHRTGEISANGRTFRQSGIYEQHRDRIAGVIDIPILNPATQLKDFQKMVDANQTFQQASSAATIASRSRLQAIFTAIQAQWIQVRLHDD